MEEPWITCKNIDKMLTYVDQEPCWFLADEMIGNQYSWRMMVHLGRDNAEFQLHWAIGWDRLAEHLTWFQRVMCERGTTQIQRFKLRKFPNVNGQIEVIFWFGTGCHPNGYISCDILPMSNFRVNPGSWWIIGISCLIQQQLTVTRTSPTTSFLCIVLW